MDSMLSTRNDTCSFRNLSEISLSEEERELFLWSRNNKLLYIPAMELCGKSLTKETKDNGYPIPASKITL